LETTCLLLCIPDCPNVWSINKPWKLPASFSLFLGFQMSGPLTILGNYRTCFHLYIPGSPNVWSIYNPGSLPISFSTFLGVCLSSPFIHGVNLSTSQHSWVSVGLVLFTILGVYLSPSQCSRESNCVVHL